VVQLGLGPESLLPLLGAYLIFIAVFWYLIIASPFLGLVPAGSIPSVFTRPAAAARAPANLSSAVLGPLPERPTQGAGGASPLQRSATTSAPSTPLQ
jgi:hypothetical protein